MGRTLPSEPARSELVRAAMLMAFGLGCASTPPVPVVPSWERGNAGLEVGNREQALWDEARESLAELAADDAFVTDAALDALLAEVLRSIAPPLDDRAPRLEARAVRSAERNAAALPNGVLLLSAGLLAALENEAQLAGLLAHELAHVVFRHRLVAREYAEITASTVDRMRLSRAQEWRADLYALERMQLTGYQPEAMPRMLHFLDSELRPVGDRVSAWESHPDLEARRRHLETLVAGPRLERPKIGANRYAEAISGILLPTAELEIEAGELGRAAQTIDRHLARTPDSGRAYYLRAEIARRTLPEGRRSLVARNAYERAVALAPEDPDALRALGLLLREGGDTERSRELLERYLHAAPDAVDRKLIERYLEPD